MNVILDVDEYIIYLKNVHSKIKYWRRDKPMQDILQ